MTAIKEQCYPEVAFGGFTRCDGTVAFYTRVQAMLSPDAAVLELGCGRGAFEDDDCSYRRNLRIFRGKCKRVVGIDVDKAAATNPHIDEFRLISDTKKWPVEDNAFQLIVCDYVLEHVTDPDAFFAEVRRVLAPGGCIAMRTVNKLSYISMASRMIPNRLHSRAVKVAQENREAEDVFPTVYRCNTKGRIQRALRRHGMTSAVVRVEPEPSYFAFSRLAYRFMSFVHAHMPGWFRSTLLIYARRVD